MGISGGFDINDIANKLMGALDNIEEEGVKKGEKIGTKVGQAVREGLAEGLKDAEAEMMNTINQWARNSKRKQSISLVEFKTNENLIRELMKTDKYANTLRESFKDLTATIDGLGEVKGLDNILDALSKDEKALKKISFGPIKPAKKTKTKIEKDPEEAIKQLEKLERDPWTIKEEEAVNNILKERLRILQKVGKEAIKTKDAQALERIIEVNEEYENRLNGFRETRDDSIYEQLGDQYGYYNDRIQSAIELQTLLAERQKRMKDIYFKDNDAYRNEQKVNEELQQRIENMQKIEDFQRKGFIKQDEVEDLVFERGTLDEKRSRLGGVQQDLFNLDDGDLDEAQLLLETYEKIIVTTASGKKLTLGPDMSEEDYKAFMKIDAEKAKSIEFIRKEKQLAIQGMEEQAEATEELAKQTDSLYDPAKRKKYTDYIDNQIKDTERSIKNQQDWIQHLGWVFDDEKFTSSGKQDAYNKLRERANRYNSISHNKAAGKYVSEDALELATIAWQKAYDEAIKKGVAESRLYDYRPPTWNYDSSLQRVQADYDYRKATLDKDEVQLTSLTQIQDNIDGFVQLCDVLEEYRQCIKDLNSGDEVLAESAANKLGNIKKTLRVSADIQDVDKQNAILDIMKTLREKSNISVEKVAEDYISRIGFLQNSATNNSQVQQQLFETPSGQISMFEGMSDPIVEANKEAEKLKDTMQEIVKISGQISFDDLAEDTKNIIYHAGDLSNIANTLKSFPLGNVPPFKGSGIGGLTGLYTTEDVNGFWGNEWSGAPISTIDISDYKLFDARKTEVADKLGAFLNDINATIYGYYESINEKDWSLEKFTDTKSIDELYKAHQELFKESDLTLEEFTQFIQGARDLVAGKSFADIDLFAIDEGIAKSGISRALQDVSQDVFNSDSFKTTLLKMLGYEGVDLRGSKYNGTYTGGTVLFDVKPESIKATNENWSDVMRRNGYEITEQDLEMEQKRRQLTFDTAKAYSKQTAQSEEQLGVEQKITSEKQQQNDLIAMHGTSTKNLLTALDQGAFSSPSIAVTRPDVYAGGYGDATVVFKKSAIDPAANPANKIYGVDAYAPTHPSFGYELNEEALIEAAERTGIALDTLRAACDGAYESVEDAAKSLSGNVSIGQQLQEAFIKELGIDLKTTETDGQILNRFHVVSDDEIINGVPDFIAQEGITFDKIVNDDAIQQAYFDEIDKYVANNNEYFADFASGQIKQVLVDEFKNSIRRARTDKSIYGEEKEYFENDQAVLRGQKKIVDVAARNDEIQRIISEKRKEYNGYVKEVLESFMVKPNTIGANGQRFDRTPEGIAMAMSSYGGKGALYDENAFMRRDIDLQSFIIAASKTYQSLDEVVLDMERLQKDATGTHTLSNTDYSISAITSSIAKANNMEDEIVFDKILRAVDGNSTAETIGKALADSGLTVDKSTVEKIAALAQEALKVPTKYFEAKPQRALGLEDIEFVSIPTDSPQSSELKSKLQEKGIRYVEHTSTDDASRAAALKAGMQQIDLIKEETAVQEELNQTRRDAPESQQAEIVADNEKAKISYEELSDAVAKFNRIVEGGGATEKEIDDADNAWAYLRDTVGQEKIDAATNEDYTLNLNKLAQYLGVEIPQAADKAIGAIRETEQAAQEMDNSKPDNTNILDFGIDMSNPMVANAFNGMNIKDWIKAYVQPDARGQLQEELYKLAQSVLAEDDNVFDAQLEHIVDFIIKNSQRRETKEPNMYDDLFKQLVVTYTDEDVATMGPQLFEEAKKVLGRRLQKRNDRNGYISGIDQLVSQIADSDYRSMFSDPDGNESQYNKFEELLKVFAKWKEDSKRKTKDVSLTDRDAPGVENNILENIVPQMMANIGATSAKLEDEQLGFEGIAASSEKAAKGKRKFTEANKQAGPSAADSAKDIEDEADALDKVNTSVEKLPGDYDSVTKYMIGGNKDPSAAVQKRVRFVNGIIQNETQRLSANESGGWDVDVTSVNEQQLRGMKEFVADYLKEAKKLDGINTDIRFVGQDGIDTKFQASIDKYLLSMANLRNAFNNLQANPDDAGLAQVFDDARRSAQDARTEVEGYLKQSQKLKQEYKGKEIANPITINASDVKNVQSAMMSFASSIEGTSFQFTKMSADGTKMFGTLDDGSGTLRNITVGLDQASGQLHIWENAASNAGHATANLTNQWEDFRTQIIDGAKRIAGMYIGVQEFMQAFRTGFNYVKEIDLAMTELKKVTDETDASYKQFLEDAAGTSGIIGSTISDFTEATANFARLGYSMEESASMAETAIVYKNVADGLDTVEESTESIISTMKAFGIEANDTMSIIDKYNEVGNNFAITSAGIGEALQRSASALFEAGNTIDESIALVTAANSVVNFVPRARSNMSTSR